MIIGGKRAVLWVGGGGGGGQHFNFSNTIPLLDQFTLMLFCCACIHW